MLFKKGWGGEIRRRGEEKRRGRWKKKKKKKKRKKEEENKIKEFKFIAPAFIKQCYRERYQ